MKQKRMNIPKLDIQNDELEAEIQPFDTQGEQLEEGIKVRGHSAVNDLGRTDSRKQAIRGIELRGSLYAPKKNKGVIATGQTQIIFDSEDLGGVKITGKTDRTLTYLLSLIPTESFFRPNEVVRVETTVANVRSLYRQKDAKATRESIDEDLANLASITIRQEEAEGDLKIGLPIAGDIWGRKRSNILFSFSPSFINLLTGGDAFSVYYPPALFGVNFKDNPHAWTIGKKLLNHSNSNLGKPNEYVLSVRALLEYVESIPSEAEVAAGDRAYTRRIAEPLERDLNALVEIGVLDYWDYCHSKGEPLTDAEQAARFDKDGKEQPIDFKLAKSLFITWKPKKEYKRLESIEAREASHTKKLAAHEEAAKKKAKRKERQEREADKIIGAAMADETLKGESD